MARPLACCLLAAAAAAALLLRRRRRQRLMQQAPVLCFGDSLTEGYHGVWHAPSAPQSPPNPSDGELEHLRFRPYALRLGARLAEAADPTAFIHYGLALRHAETRAYSGWTAAELRERLGAALNGGPWRAVVILAGTNDVVMEGTTAEVAAGRVRALWRLCDRCACALFPPLPVTYVLY